MVRAIGRFDFVICVGLTFIVLTLSNSHYVNSAAMSCSREEIEKKRLAALQKRQTKIISQNTTQLGSPANFNRNQLCSPSASTSRAGPLKTFSNNTPKSYHPYAKPKIQVETNSVPVGKVVSGTIYLISEERFEVNPSEFCTPLINIFKSLPSKNYG